jgi:hypothetical protein
MEETKYHNIPDQPETYTASSILVRLVDGVGFRYKWATEGLTKNDYKFRPSPDSMNIRELLIHIRQLVLRVNNSIEGKNPTISEKTTLEEVNNETLSTIWEIRSKLEKMNDEQLSECKYYSTSQGKSYPFWNVVNGPICDALTHIGQINSWRRLNGNPVLGANVFLGEPPKQ